MFASKKLIVTRDSDQRLLKMFQRSSEKLKKQNKKLASRFPEVVNK